MCTSIGFTLHMELGKYCYSGAVIPTLEYWLCQNTFSFETFGFFMPILQYALTC